MLSYASVYQLYAERHKANAEQRRLASIKHRKRTIDLYQDVPAEIAPDVSSSSNFGFERMQKCRRALEAIDRRKWDRSFHQRQFHDNFLRACARIFWKTCEPGEFQRSHERILSMNGWDSLRQEVLVSTPRRFGKTISVSMFAAAMLYSCPKLEMSIYSTCKRISQKLLNNVFMFLELIEAELGGPKMKVLRKNMEEIVMMGSDVEQDKRTVNSYPSKVSRLN